MANEFEAGTFGVSVRRYQTWWILARQRLIITRTGRIFCLDFFGIFFVPQEVEGTCDSDFGFGFTEWETAGDIVRRKGVTSEDTRLDSALDADQATALIGFRTAIRITPTVIELFHVDIAGLFKALSSIR